MKNKIKIILMLFFLAFISYEIYFFMTKKANVFIYVTGQSSNTLKDDKAILIIDSKVIDTINLNQHFAYYEVLTLPFGKSKVQVKGAKHQYEFETSVSFWGLFNWNVIEYTDEGFKHQVHFLPPIIE